MFKNRMIILLLLATVSSCGANKFYNHDPGATQKPVFIPDSSINGLALRNEKTLSTFFSGKFELLPESEKRSFPVAYFLNISSTQYLAIYHYYGDLKNDFSLFEIGYRNNLLDTTASQTNYGFFTTENKIQLGITENELAKIKGNADTVLQDGKMKVMRYVLKDSKSQFLKRYNLPYYFAEYYIELDKVVKFKFGFDYP